MIVFYICKKNMNTDQLLPTDYEYVDLGLSVYWATFNVGATNPHEPGDFFSWGEIEPKDNYDWTTYKWCNGSPNHFTKYNTARDYGIVDNKNILDPEDDVAHVKWGGKWRMPTECEIYEPQHIQGGVGIRHDMSVVACSHSIRNCVCIGVQRTQAQFFIDFRVPIDTLCNADNQPLLNQPKKRQAYSVLSAILCKVLREDTTSSSCLYYPAPNIVLSTIHFEMICLIFHFAMQR